MADSSADPIVVQILVDADGSVSVQADEPPESLWRLLREASDAVKPRGQRGRPRHTDGFEIKRLLKMMAEVHAAGRPLVPAEVADVYGAHPRTLERWLAGRGLKWSAICAVFLQRQIDDSDEHGEATGGSA